MKIGSSLDTPPMPGNPSRAGRTGAATSPAVDSARATVALSAAGTELGAASVGEFDSRKVDAIRQAIREGRFSVNAGAIADRLIADAAALLAPRASA